jgi:hypothetical protein
MKGGGGMLTLWTRVDDPDNALVIQHVTPSTIYHRQKKYQLLYLSQSRSFISVPRKARKILGHQKEQKKIPPNKTHVCLILKRTRGC